MRSRRVAFLRRQSCKPCHHLSALNAQKITIIFGLALLIFHVLFGGRHPYSGVPLISDAGNALETDIAHFRYAYASDNQRRGLKPPPRSIPLSMLPGDVEAMFQQAFTESGVATGRPTAKSVGSGT